MVIVPLNSRIHDRAGFDCGVKPLNNFLKLTANQLGERDHSRSYVLVDPIQPSQIIGFYTLTMINFQLDNLPLTLQNKHKFVESAGLISRLAVDKRFQGKRFGSKLLVDALVNLKRAAEIVGFPVVFVDAKEGRADFYSQYGFEPIDKQRLFMTVAAIRKMLSKYSSDVA
ncbi:GNAT family N-acetyltransferase [Testudinibacter sp. TR-2022]|uniref:GNAT family N-acetyltransferase n=1 Tax=Testudinibacter sp. TR-2022 TaxID=2585029 RepID=UPI001117DED3|nr:GNAT family N-acetyltransferase [Testudinibacter sp. TR-2022]TNH03530.1 GNAT family N-acetyltransferase [Pasteurellaceae bacterium Phil31]TNH07546.1 GNAT family N-acetyltransferase [Testudinibacter sp. TR-2022]TNH09687.1 GNAT family N-acetyltransferase [Testudinibacter sp. TR-2022]TNH13234.1 GNAT family N-acetyltransferase [Testudinibacter sp. TR-2022]TNH20850.1 GNAT family N-acetyltransferase [Testudinibacter sp. TR-2022]